MSSERTGRVPAADPGWRDGIRPGRRIVLRPGALPVGAAMAAAALACLALAGYGAVRADAIWAVLAGLSVVAVLVLTLRGFPLLALLPLVIGAVAWGLTARAQLPESWGDILGVLAFGGGNLLFVVILVAMYLAALAVDARRLAQTDVADRVFGRRWWGEPAEHMPELAELEAIPAARFFAAGLFAPGEPVAVVAGSRVAVLLPTVWPRGEYTIDPDGLMLRGGRPFAPGADDLETIGGGLRAWQRRLTGTGAACRGFLVVHPPGAGADVRLDVAPGQHLELVHASVFGQAVGAWLAAEPYRIDVTVMRRLLPALDTDAAPQSVAAEATRSGPRRRRAVVPND